MSQLQSSMEMIETLLRPDGADANLHKIRDAFGLQNLAYFGLPSFGSLQTPPRLRVTYDDLWVNHYKKKRYATSDPVLLEGMRRDRIFDWATLDKEAPTSQTFFGEAREFEIGTSGLTIPITGQGKPIALISFTSEKSGDEWRDFKREFQPQLQLLSLALHDNVWHCERLNGEDEALTDRETECLKWSAIGKTAFETSVIIGISERTVRHHLEMSRKKLDASNITHAVVKAINANMLGMNF